ncbi:MAG: ATP phosphoribosyltransferase [Clostridiales bacterium]|jgi:ATP phosphoribosyltransferase|nr:ATP phosphoribosyltransferase [Clostridiales bacterium]
MEYLTFALAKGRLAELAMDRLSSIGIDCVEMKEKSRKLIFVNEALKLKFFLSKANDVPTYVEYGAADIGIAGKDTLMEEKRKTYELFDLGFGKCRIVVAGRADSADKIYKNNNLRVATKYPNIARDYFHNQKQQTVEIIKLNGSVELGPIVGLADVIVDIVETGSTLKENGLVVIDEIADVSARMIVNRVSMKMEHERVSEIIKKLKGSNTILI